jgi:hypothetical protein
MDALPDQPGPLAEWETIKSLGPSLLRTVVPVAVGWLISLPVVGALGIDSSVLTTLVTALATIVYYVAVRLIERFLLPEVGWLLGYPAEPAYVALPSAGKRTGP